MRQRNYSFFFPTSTKTCKGEFFKFVRTKFEKKTNLWCTKKLKTKLKHLSEVRRKWKTNVLKSQKKLNACLPWRTFFLLVKTKICKMTKSWSWWESDLKKTSLWSTKISRFGWKMSNYFFLMRACAKIGDFFLFITEKCAEKSSLRW